MVTKAKDFVSEWSSKAVTWMFLAICGLIYIGASSAFESRVRPIAKEEAEKVGKRLVDSSRVAEDVRFSEMHQVFADINRQNREIRIYLEYKDPNGWAKAKRSLND